VQVWLRVCLPLPAIVRPTRNSRIRLQTLGNRLHQIRDEFHGKLQQLSPGSVVEIEAKLGLIVDNQTDGRYGPFTPGAGAIELLPVAMQGKRFVSGVSKDDFAAYQAVQEKMPARQLHRSKTYAHTFPGGKRVQTDAHGNVVMEQKTKELEFQIHLPSCPYDCRITVSIERPLEAAEKPALTAGWESRRTKDRYSYSDGRPQRSKWQADLTKVSTEQGSGGASEGPASMEQTFEVELELKAEDCTQWIQLGDAKVAKDRTHEVARDLWERLQAMMPREQTAGALIEVKEHSLEEAGQNACLAPFQGRSDRGFPGTLPIGFNRRLVQKVQREKYFVSEKTDGVRHFLVVVRDQGKLVALLFDRKFKAWTMDGMAELGEALGEGTVLDGEVVRNRSWKRDIFMVFDCMSVGTQSCAQEVFEKRLKKLQKDVLGDRYLRFLAEHPEQVNKTVNAEMKVLPLVMKHFFPTKKVPGGSGPFGVGEITRHIKFEGGERVYLECDSAGRPLPSRKRHHKSDGLIFAPDKPYHCGTDFHYMKWKWHDTITLDFECRRDYRTDGPGVALAFAADGNQTVDFTDHIVLGVHERYRLFGDMSAQRGILITEWEWNPARSGWVYKMPRPDKNRSNFSRTVLSTIMELAEGMDIEELEYRLTFSRPEEDDWDEAIARRRTALLAERKSAASNGNGQ